MVKCATLNLLHWAKPGIYWHQRDAQRVHTPASWTAKTGWLASVLETIDADVVAFQEVVSAGELQYLCYQLGYTEFAFVTEPRLNPDDVSVYTNASLAIASRFPIREAHEIGGFGGLIKDTILDSAAQFSRPALRTIIEVPPIGEVVVYCVHLKSPGTRVDADVIDNIEENEAKLSRFFLERAEAGVDQVAKRAGEAAALYARARHDLSHDRLRPVLIMGDFNDTPQSYTLDIITQRRTVHALGSAHGDALPDDLPELARNFLLFDSEQWAASPLPQRPVTFRDPTTEKTAILDYILVSAGLHPDTPARRAAVIDYQVYTDHFDGGLDADTSSDHAPIMVTIEPT